MKNQNSNFDLKDMLTFQKTTFTISQYYLDFKNI